MSNDPFVEDDHAESENCRSGDEFFKSMSEALKGGAEQARQKAEEAAPTIKSALEKAAYAISFGAAYSGSFGATMVRELIPGALKEGGSEGFHAGKAAAEHAMEPGARGESATGPGDDADVEYSVS